MFNQKGFTIVELVAVIMIIGIISAIAAPKFIGNDAFAARGAYGTLISGLRLAQKTAIAQRKPVYVNLNTTSKVLCLGYDATCTTGVLDPATQAAYSKTLPSTVTLTTTLNPIQFTASGKESANNTVTLTVQNNVTSEAARTITIERDTGYVH
jgi:MSHA pilin protein MshC